LDFVKQNTFSGIATPEAAGVMLFSFSGKNIAVFFLDF
jgi:hypothetical protein